MIQDGAYGRLLDAYYAHEKPLPLDLPTVYAMARAVTVEEHRAVDEILAEFFKKTTVGFTNNRGEMYLKQVTNWRKRQKNHRDTSRDILRDSHGQFTRDNNRDSHGNVTVSPSPSPSPSLKKEKVKTFQPPLQAEVCAYMQSRGIPDAERQAELFIAHHANREWHLGGGKGPLMADWKKAVITWQGNISKFNGRRANGHESFDERRRRQSQEAIREVGARAREVVSEVERRLPKPPSD